MKSYEIARVWGDWLRQWRWEWWATLTFRYPVKPRQGHSLWKRWLHALEGEVKGKIHYVRVTEVQRCRGDIPHYHALLKGTKKEKPEKWQSIWYQFGGFAKIEVYNPSLGATYYVAKYLSSDIGDIIFSKHIEKTAINTISNP